MKKILLKINESKILFIVFIVFCLSIFGLVVSGFGFWNGLATEFFLIFDKIYNYTKYGKEFVLEFICLLLIIPIILIFKNKYIFSQKRIGLFKSLLISWPILLYTFIIFMRSLMQISISNINKYEVVALLLLTICIGAFEEIMCRGWLQNEFIERFGKNRKGVIFSIIISGCIFGLMHITNLYYGQDVFNTLVQVIAAAAIGICLGSVYYKTKNIWVVIILHGLWDFAVFFSEINISTTCTEIASSINNISPIIGFLALFSALFSSLPEIGMIFILLNKKDINEGLEEKNKIKLSNEEINQCEKTKLIFSIAMLIFLVLYGVLILFMGNMKTDTCPTYVKKQVENYTETIFNYSSYNIDNKYNLKIDDKYNLILTDLSNNDKYELEYKNIFSMAIFENQGIYNIIILSEEDNGNIITYYSNYIKDNNMDYSKAFIENFIKSFNQVMIPVNIDSIGYYQEINNNYKYPLFISSTKDAYILYSDGTIYKYKK